ncbi:hypothetical protein ARALYDRAFT_915770 [Arabidopsis lyrata subsp. lyrata]|uniref:Pentatricopeptide repeat-containing protein n=1 Tax=Arabidopsis lyrata subsp. lyrata TaxID=81972 RepID=D7MI22_ARALL|nr:hypothetical protein ARALYDRAFT_915770 [Arabidopsis lyrata subsp. lyrata]
MMENEGIEPNLIMLNVLINAFGTVGKHMEALSIYHHIKESGFTPDVVTYSTLMKAFTRAKKYEKGNGSLWVYCRSESKTTIAKCFYGS